MKAISEMTLPEALDALSTFTSRYANCVLAEGDEPTEELNALAERIHDLTRWIPVEERLPTEADANENGNVRWHSDYFSEQQTDCWDWVDSSYTHWRRIDKPEAQP